MIKKKIIGERSGRLEIIGHDHDEVKEVPGKHGTKKNTIHYVRCRCDCGKVKVFRYSDIHSKSTKSCGCLLGDKIRERCQTHGLWKHPLYTHIYMKMVERCYRKTISITMSMVVEVFISVMNGIRLELKVILDLLRSITGQSIMDTNVN